MAQVKCKCGRPREAATTTVLHTQKKGVGVNYIRVVNHRCECGEEWATWETEPNPNDVVSVDEVITMHELLAGPVSMDDILKGKS